MATPRPIKTANKPQHVKRSLSSIIFILEYKMNRGGKYWVGVKRGLSQSHTVLGGADRWKIIELPGAPLWPRMLWILTFPGRMWCRRTWGSIRRPFWRRRRKLLSLRRRWSFAERWQRRSSQPHCVSTPRFALAPAEKVEQFHIFTLSFEIIVEILSLLNDRESFFACIT